MQQKNIQKQSRVRKGHSCLSSSAGCLQPRAIEFPEKLSTRPLYHKGKPSPMEGMGPAGHSHHVPQTACEWRSLFLSK